MADTEDSRERNRAYQRKWMSDWRTANTEKSRAQQRTYHAENRDKLRAYKREWRRKQRVADPEKARAQDTAHSREWKAMNPWRAAYNSKKSDAKSRGVPFLLTFEEWWAIWRDSGKWAERGCRKGQYVMARFGDKGPYAVGNVRICTTYENNSERVVIFTEDTLKRLSAAQKESHRRNPRSEEVRKRIAESVKRAHQRKPFGFLPQRQGPT